MRVLFACTRGAGHFNPLVPFVDACRRAGHEVMVVGPQPLAAAVQRAGYPFWVGAAPGEEELGRVWAQVPTVSYEEAERLVIGEIFATLNVRAMLPAMRAAVQEWQPDVVVREPAEFASALICEEAGVPHVQVAISLVGAHTQMLSIAAEPLEAWASGLSERVAVAPYLTLFPAALEDPQLAGPPQVHRFRLAGTEMAASRLPDWWAGDERPLVYVTFGSVTGTVPTAAPIYRVALEAVTDLPARVLVTTGEMADDLSLPDPAPHVHVARWVPQADVLAHARLVVCHGGSGTTLGTLAAGVPIVVTPLFADQPHNGRRVAAVGAGLVVEPTDTAAMRSAIDPADLHEAIATVLAEERFALAARAIADEMRALPPPDAALTVLAAVA